VSVSALLESALQFHRSGKLEQARTFYERVIALDPSLAVAHNLLGALLCGEGDLASGEACFRRAVEADPTNVEALNNLANVRKDCRDFAEAESLYCHALELEPAFSAAANNLGLLYLATNRFEDAGRSFRRAAAIDPGNADAYNNLGVALRRQGAFADAEDAFRKAIAVNSNQAEALCGLGDVLILRGELDAAETCCQRAVEIRPGYADALNNLATIAKARGDLDIASAYCETALRLDPRHVGALNNLASVATRRADHERARAIYRAALETAPKDAVTRFNAGVNLLTLGEYAEGLDLYESRFAASGRHLSTLPALDQALRSRPQWSGGNSHCEQLLVWCEQGLGDTLMMLRYLPLLRERGVASCVVLCDPSLQRVVTCVKGADVVVTSPEEALKIDFDAHCPIMTLPRAFGTTSSTIPDTVPYVYVPKAMADAWCRRVQGDARPAVGLVWAGSRTLQEDARRSISFKMLRPLFTVERFKFVTLQKGDAAAEWSRASRIANYIDDCTDFLDTAALVTALDLVVAVDTAVAHLAGALGKPVWLLNRFGSEWRWGHNMARSPWYPTMQLFNQARPGDWEEVVLRVRQALQNYRPWRFHETSRNTTAAPLV
jgi:Flp pilus assembly protein TadD